MINLLLSNPLAFAISFAGLVICLTIHEFAHAWVADKLGDPTPRLQDRLTLNPLAHLDTMGTLLLVLIGFGWGKPVEIDSYNLENPVRDSALIALAGPLVNIIFALIIGGILRFGPIQAEWITTLLFSLFFMNLNLAFFNLIPVHPLDGSKIILALLPRQLSIEYEQIIEQFGMFILFALLIPIVSGTSIVSIIITPVVRLATHLILGTPLDALF